MGNARSVESVCEEDVWWTNSERQQQRVTNTSECQKVSAKNEQETIFCDITRISDREQRKKELEEDFDQFKEELARKHERRREIMADKKKELTNLRADLITEKEKNNKLRQLLEKNQQTQKSNIASDYTSKECESALLIVNSLKEENEDLRNEAAKLRLLLNEKEALADKNKELRISLAEMQKELQSVNTQILGFEKERIDYDEHVTALKDIIRVTKEMLRVRESQIDELKKKISSIEEILASKEMNILSDDLRQEYERQLRNIRDLRALYDERQRADRREKENLQSQIEDLKKNLEDEQNKNGEFKERIDELEEDQSKKYDKIFSLESNLGLAKAECRELHAEMEIINQLFSQILISFNNDQDIDLDNMTKILEENHDLLKNIVINDESGEASALPKLLLDLVNQVNENKRDNKDNISLVQECEQLPPPENINEKLDTIQEEEESQASIMHQLNSPEEIVENLPKVWRVLIELLSHQCPPNNEITEKKGENDNHCYKSVETPTGLREVLSVSKTFIRLKSLILEKKALEKEMTRLKQLNTHLEGRLSDQEKRLVLVSNELSKTWNFVGKMQKQHQQLHTQEKILRYELAQKRKLLTELKEELEYCRQKWLQARQQNSSTEEQWKQLRTEFASRKRITNDDANNSVESGYSDDKSSSDDDDPDFRDKAKGAEETAKEEDVGGREKEEEETHAESVAQEKILHETSNLSEHNENPPTDDNNTITDERLLETNNEHTVDPEIAEIDRLCSDVQASALVESENSSLDVLHSLPVQKTDIEDNDDAKRQTENLQISTIDTSITEEHKTDECLLDPNQNDSVEKTQKKLFDQHCSTNDQTNNNLDLEGPSTSNKNPSQAAEEFVARREERMKNLEEQCNQLFCSVAKTSLRGVAMSYKLDNLHEIYGDNSQSPTEQETETMEVHENAVPADNNSATQEENSVTEESASNTSNQE